MDSSSLLSNALRRAKRNNLSLFTRLSAERRAHKATMAVSRRKSSQLQTLAQHVEKLMHFVRTEAASRVCVEERLADAHKELLLARQASTAHVREAKASREKLKDIGRRNHILNQQLDLMDVKCQEGRRQHRRACGRLTRQVNKIRREHEQLGIQSWNLRRAVERYKAAQVKQSATAGGDTPGACPAAGTRALARVECPARVRPRSAPEQRAGIAPLGGLLVQCCQRVTNEQQNGCCVEQNDDRRLLAGYASATSRLSAGRAQLRRPSSNEIPDRADEPVNGATKRKNDRGHLSRVPVSEKMQARHGEFAEHPTLPRPRPAASIPPLKSFDPTLSLRSEAASGCTMSRPAGEFRLRPLQGAYASSCWHGTFTACNSGDYRAVRDALDKGCPVDARQQVTGNTLLMVAIVHTNGWSTIKLLIRRKANVHSVNNVGWSPLHFAVATGKLDVADYLMTYGAKPNLCSGKFHGTPLHVAVEAKSVDAICRLVEEHSQLVNDTDGHGRTALHICALTGDVEMARFLCEHAGADVTLCDRKKLSPLQYAARRDFFELEEYFMGLLSKKG